MDSSVVGPMSGTRRKRAKQLRTQSAETPSNNEIGYGHSAHRSLKTPCTRVQMTGATMSSGQREQGTGPVNAGLPPAFPEEHGSGFCVRYCTTDLQPPIHPHWMQSSQRTCRPPRRRAPALMSRGCCSRRGQRGIARVLAAHQRCACND
jgi:hypothetical protein